MKLKKVNIEQSWYNLLENEFEKKYFTDLRNFIKTECLTKLIFPPPKLIFNAFNLTPVNKVKELVDGLSTC